MKINSSQDASSLNQNFDMWRKSGIHRAKMHPNNNSSYDHNYTDVDNVVVMSGGLTKSQCTTQFGERRYLPSDRQRTPPLLYTFPGSGNTWCRLLIEYATGIYTGSLFHDKTLIHVLPGEYTCSTGQSVIKAHPFTTSYSLRTGNYSLGKNKCQKGGIARFDRSVLLIRDPYYSIWSEFERACSKSHVGGILKKDFNENKWKEAAMHLSHQYQNMWAVQYADMEENFAKKDILYIEYDELKNKETRVETLRKVTQFLDIFMPNDAQLECAFALADNRDTHRIVDKSTTMSKEEAYTPSLVCEMWALFGVHAEKHGYHIWRDINCSK